MEHDFFYHRNILSQSYKTLAMQNKSYSDLQYAQLLNNSTPPLTVNNGVLFYQTKQVIPESKIDSICRSIYEDEQLAVEMLCISASMKSILEFQDAV